MATVTSTGASFEKVDDTYRQNARGQWAPLIQELASDPTATIFVANPDGQKAKGSLVQAMRSRGKKLHSSATTHKDTGVQGYVFWAEDKI